MCGYTKVNKYNEAVNKAKLFCELKTEMSDSQLGFLCGLIRDKRPQKIVEVGVAAGGTTLVILQCIKELGLDASLFSVDINNKLYSDATKETGYIAKQIEDNKVFESINHNYCLGGFLPEALPEIGRNIDFLVLDTVHYLPGEILDFLAALPYLSDDAIVVLHDVALQHADEITDYNCFATQVLFSSVTGKKMLNNKKEYPNIAAFQLNKSTYENIYDLFSALSLTWDYIPSQKELDIYKLWYEKNYDQEACLLFDQVINMNMKTIVKMCDQIDDYMKTFCDAVLSRYNKVFLYGAGKRGRAFFKALEKYCDADILKNCKYVVSDFGEAQKNNYIAWESLDADFNSIIILSAKCNEIKERLRNSEWHWMDIPDSIWKEIERVFGI